MVSCFLVEILIAFEEQTSKRGIFYTEVLSKFSLKVWGQYVLLRFSWPCLMRDFWPNLDSLTDALGRISFLQISEEYESAW